MTIMLIAMLLYMYKQSPFFTVVNSRAALAAVLDKAGGGNIKGVAYKSG